MLQQTTGEDKSTNAFVVTLVAGSLQVTWLHHLPRLGLCDAEVAFWPSAKWARVLFGAAPPNM